MKYQSIFTAVGLAVAGSLSSIQAALIVTYAENPGSLNTSVPNAQADAFGGLTSGQYNNLAWPGTGSLNGTTVATVDKVYLQTADQYGVAPVGGVYPVQSTGGVGGGLAVPTSTITFAKPSAYFGLFWSAGDAHNELSFYRGTTLEAQFTTATLLGLLPNTYRGNPMAAFQGQDYGENFAFLNFYGSAGTDWTSVQLTDDSGSGFESDNWTTRVGAWGTDPQDQGTYPGVPVAEIPAAAPEPANLVAGMVVSLVFIAAALRKRSRRTTVAKAG